MTDDDIAIVEALRDELSATPRIRLWRSDHELAAALSALLRDVKRYAWLREQMHSEGRAMIDILQQDGDWSRSRTPITPEELDAALDAAMEAKP